MFIFIFPILWTILMIGKCWGLGGLGVAAVKTLYSMKKRHWSYRRSWIGAQVVARWRKQVQVVSVIAMLQIIARCAEAGGEECWVC